MDAVERFLEYTKWWTTSDEESGVTPSTARQMDFAYKLKEDLEKSGFQEIELDELGYLYATLPANTAEKLPTIGFIAHMDTSPDMSGENVKPRIVRNYDGKDIVLNAEQNIVLSTVQFPEILQYKGQDIIVTDGTTLLGADDKAGIVEIISACEYLMAHPEIKHGKIRVGFNPDEEIGMGAHKFDVKKFGCDWAYTMDGGEIGELEYENFNAASAKLKFKGLNVHPGSAKGKMRNAIRMAQEFITMVPAELPENTEGYDGFYHVVASSGTVEEASLSWIIRDHDKAKFEERKRVMERTARWMNEKYGEGAVEIELKDQYYNMREMVEPEIHIIDRAFKAMEEAGVKPKVSPIRGGTDGAQLSFKGLLCPNIFAGGHNFHGRYEYLPINSMMKAIEVIVNIVKNN
ncbi:MAG: peptidase T [Paludibacteraceae bacterium]|nr:peptidase T [Paludibacteraceae bacterium]